MRRRMRTWVPVVASLAVCLGAMAGGNAATKKSRGSTSASTAVPRLVVILVADQMAANYLDRFDRYFGVGGFRRLRTEGRDFTAARYAHASTLTGPGHAVIGTGAYADQTGLIANGWWDVRRGTTVNSAIGPLSGPENPQCLDEFPASPTPETLKIPNPCNLRGMTLAERVRKKFPASRVVGLALKDRSAILPPGKGADAAYYLSIGDNGGGEFRCSAYYRGCRNEIIDWGRERGLNGKPGMPVIVEKERPEWKRWECSLPAPCEAACPDDVIAGHAEDVGLGRTFPHPVRDVESLVSTPHGNDLLEELAERVIEIHSLGANPSGEPDILTVGFSSIDYYGHLFGPDSCETVDGMKRFDATLARLLAYLDKRIGRDRVLLFLTSDHGVTPLPEVSLKKGIPAGRVDLTGLTRIPKKTLGELPLLRQRLDFGLAGHLGLKEDTTTPAGEALIAFFREPNLYLNRDRIPAASLPDARAWVRDYIKQVEGVEEVYTHDEIAKGNAPEAIRKCFNPDRSGDLLVVLRPYWVEWTGDGGTSHGQPHDEDARVPLLIWGSGVEPGRIDTPTDLARLAATLVSRLGLESTGLQEPLPLGPASRSASK